MNLDVDGISECAAGVIMRVEHGTCPLLVVSSLAITVQESLVQDF